MVKMKLTAPKMSLHEGRDKASQNLQWFPLPILSLPSYATEDCSALSERCCLQELCQGKYKEKEITSGVGGKSCDGQALSFSVDGRGSGEVLAVDRFGHGRRDDGGARKRKVEGGRRHVKCWGKGGKLDEEGVPEGRSGRDSKAL